MTWTSEEKNVAYNLSESRKSGIAKEKAVAEFTKIFKESDVDKN